MGKARAQAKTCYLITSLLALNACANPVVDPSTGKSAISADALAQLSTMAAPYQDLGSVELRPDGCYWYRHVGPVETTMLPLRMVDGRPICARAVTPTKA